MRFVLTEKNQSSKRCLKKFPFFFFFFQKLSIYGDSEYIKEQKLIPYPASSLLIITSNGSEEEAGPLPSKVNLGQSNI